MPGLCYRWTYLTSVMPVKDSLLQPLEDVIRQKFLPALTGEAPCNDQVRCLLALPPRHGGLGITNPLTVAQTQHHTSATICQPLLEAILGQEGTPTEVRALQRQLKNEQRKRHRKEQADLAKSLIPELPQDLQEVF